MTHLPLLQRTRRSGALLVAATTGLLATSALVASPAQAAWGTSTTVHGAKAQLCQVPLTGGEARVKLRLNNRRGEHTHLATLSRERGERVSTVRSRAAAGKVSRVRSLRVRPGDSLSTGVRETNGVGAGGGASLEEIPGCKA